MRESPQRVFLYVFGLPEFNSELYFSENFLVPALGNLSTLRVQHCREEVVPDLEYVLSTTYIVVFNVREEGKGQVYCLRR